MSGSDIDQGRLFYQTAQAPLVPKREQESPWTSSSSVSSYDITNASQQQQSKLMFNSAQEMEPLFKPRTPLSLPSSTQGKGQTLEGESEHSLLPKVSLPSSLASTALYSEVTVKKSNLKLESSSKLLPLKSFPLVIPNAPPPMKRNLDKIVESRVEEDEEKDDTDESRQADENSSSEEESDDEEDDEDEDTNADDPTTITTNMSLSLMKALGLDTSEKEREVKTDWKPPAESGLNNSHRLVAKPIFDPSPKLETRLAPSKPIVAPSSRAV
eukprot:gene2782-3390_t